MSMVRAAVAGLVAVAVMVATPVTARAEGEGGAGSRRGSTEPTVTVLNADALNGLGSGSAVGPGGALYVTNSTDGTLLRVDPDSGQAVVVGSGLPPELIDIGGATDVVFWKGRAYVIVMLAGADVGGSAATGVYRLGDDGRFLLFADIGAFARAHPPADPDVFLAEGVLYAIDVWRNSLVITDGHHARVYQVDRRGRVSELLAFPNTDDLVTGVEVADGRLLLTTPGPIPHLPASSKVLEFRRGETTVVGQWPASYQGNRGLIVDVEVGPRHRLYGLLQGHWDLPDDPSNEGFPAARNTGELVRIEDGKFKTIVGGLDQPTSLDFIGRSAFVVTYTGTIVRIDGL
ncbi:MAG: hypothetical protein ACKV2O_05350 [Acidimicrobiales bacterium]